MARAQNPRRGRAALLARAGGAPHCDFVVYGFEQRTGGSLAAWRAAHPGAQVANVLVRRDLVDADFAHFAGIKALLMIGCDNPALTSAAFAAPARRSHAADGQLQPGVHRRRRDCAPVRRAHTLSMHRCTQAALTDGAFVHLRGLYTLDMSGW